jgi:hypothetical protein
MAFLDALRRTLAGDPTVRDVDRMRLVEAWGLSDTSHPEFPGPAPAADPAAVAASPAATEYDRTQWRRKLKRILDNLPDSQGQWRDLLAEAGALGFDPAWVQQCQREEFALLIRRVVSDRVVTPLEHDKLDLARTLIGLPEAEAVQTLHAIVAEAEAFFGKSISGVSHEQ